MAQIDSLPPLREVIARDGLQAKKNLGQNFLLDLNLTGKIARSVPQLDRAQILEIGPGPGGLTRALLAEGAKKVVALEKDTRCIPALQEIAAHYPNKLEIIEADALKFDPRPYLSSPVRIVANLPYNIGTELLIRWLKLSGKDQFWQSLTLMFQREVAARIIAQPKTKTYGRLSVLSAWRCTTKIIMELPAEAFTPSPKVASAVVHLERRPSPQFPCALKDLETVTKAAFGQRRKMLRSSLKTICDDPTDRLKALGISPTARAETLSVEDFCALARSFEEE